jgi:N-acetyl-anhydromuramyl-L-alanine amidase AmpD
MKRVIVHWTAGTNKASLEDEQHYHYIIQGDGSIMLGAHTLKDNDNVADGKYAAHTRGCNEDSIGVSLCGMYGAVESPFKKGRYPINERQWRVMLWLVSRLAKQHNIPITPQTILTHAEVEGTLKIKQAGKWDITRLPWDSSVVGATAVGNLMRKSIKEIK